MIVDILRQKTIAVTVRKAKIGFRSDSEAHGTPLRFPRAVAVDVGLVFSLDHFVLLTHIFTRQFGAKPHTIR